MLQVLWGFVFLLFDINVSSYSIDILPDFIGWILIVFGSNRVLLKCKVFTFVKVSGIFMIFVSLLQFVVSFMGRGNFVYTYLSRIFSMENADFAYLLDNIFWGLKLVVFALFNVRDRLGDIKRIRILRDVWLGALIIEIATFLLNNFVSDYIPETLQNAFMQILVLGVIFFKIWIVFSVYKVKKVLNIGVNNK